LIFVLLFSFYSLAQIIKINDDLYYSQKSEDLFFVLEKVNESNVSLWQKFAKEQEDMANMSSAPLRVFFKYLRSNKKDFNQESFDEFIKQYAEAELENPDNDILEVKDAFKNYTIYNASHDPLSKFVRCMAFYNRADVWAAKDDLVFLLKKDDQEIFRVDTPEEVNRHWWFFSNTQPSKTHPYVVVDLLALSQLFVE
jgi:hypothetical protein